MDIIQRFIKQGKHSVIVAHIDNPMVALGSIADVLVPHITVCNDNGINTKYHLNDLIVHDFEEFA